MNLGSAGGSRAPAGNPAKSPFLSLSPSSMTALASRVFNGYRPEGDGGETRRLKTGDRFYYKKRPAKSSDARLGEPIDPGPGVLTKFFLQTDQEAPPGPSLPHETLAPPPAKNHETDPVAPSGWSDPVPDTGSAVFTNLNRPIVKAKQPDEIVTRYKPKKKQLPDRTLGPLRF
jgi:hypothetical protein